NCVGDGTSQTKHNAESPNHQLGTCADGDGFTLADAVDACEGHVKYFSYACADFPATPPSQANDERAWTAYYGCYSVPAGGASGSAGSSRRGGGSPHAGTYRVPERVFTVANLDVGERERAAQSCAGVGISNRALLDACIVDVAVTGDAAFAEPFRHLAAPR